MYMVFDLLYLNGEDLMRIPLVRRREILKGLLPKDGRMRYVFERTLNPCFDMS